MEVNNTSILKGTFFTVGFRCTDRLIGVASMMILARLLSPNDFGIIAIAYLAVNFARVFLDFGVQVALIQIKNIDQSHYDTAWTIRIIQTSIITCILLASSHYIAEYFQEDRTRHVLYFLAFLPLLNGLQNIGVISFQKNMQFGAEFRFLFIQRILGFSITVTSALMLHSYWALVIGSLATEFIGLILSYIVHPMRARLSLSKFKDIFFISQWMLLKNIGIYLQDNLHNFFVGRWSSTSVLGAYSIAGEISRMPSTELLAPFNRVLLPAFSKVQDQAAELKRIFLLAQGVQTLIAVPAAVGLALVANEAVLLFLGDKWVEAIPYVQILALVGIFTALVGTSHYLMIVLGQLRLNVLVIYTKVILFCLLMVTIFLKSSAIVTAWVFLCVSVLGIILSFVFVISIFPSVKFIDFSRNSIRPFLGVVAMTLTLTQLDIYIYFSLLTTLIIKVLLGASIYATVVIALWVLSGKPNSSEKYLLNKFFNIYTKYIKN